MLKRLNEKFWIFKFRSKEVVPFRNAAMSVERIKVKKQLFKFYIFVFFILNKLCKESQPNVSSTLRPTNEGKVQM
jgi:hypothetical protein